MPAGYDREHPRYVVAHLKGLSFYIERKPEPNALLSLSLGGCGLYFIDEDSRFKCGGSGDEEKITFGFEFLPAAPSRIDIMGNCHYQKRVKIGGISYFYYGFKFRTADRVKIEPIIKELARLESEKIIETH